MTSTCIAGFSLETWHENSFKTQCFESWIRGCGWGCQAMICQMPDVPPCPKARARANNWKKSCFCHVDFFFSPRMVRILEDFWPALLAACQVHLGKAMPTNAIQGHHGGHGEDGLWSVGTSGEIREKIIMPAFKHFCIFRSWGRLNESNLLL